ncbi:nucleotidyltransferase family protein [Anaeromyxobacter paludicola]|uniref:Uncharacterized protein n=1 Tax=Anaeromyxobacter paludicola TaxID=2918171 RepID=A0ABM7XCR1_9BACT|nr:nucleotidyltransferase family protein [Anaeromyxobacter paludicola]BDG09658.1 hypothetical protein AMPC_27710 [Anaeromyxobacter paludicola]
MPLLDAIRALAAFDPPAELPPCDLDDLVNVLESHGLAPMASYQVESRPLGARLPERFRERLLTSYQGVVNDNVFKLVTLKGALRELAGVRAVLLGAAATVDWLYPHLAFRPVGDLRLAVRGEDGARFAAGLGGDFQPASTGAGGHTAVFSDGRIELRIQEGLLEGTADDGGLFDRATPFRAMGPGVARPAPEDALLLAAADQALEGLRSQLVTFVDVRELVRLDLDRATLHARAARLGLSRALHGSLSLTASFFPEVAERTLALLPVLLAGERALVEAVIEGARDPGRLRVLRGEQEAARKVLLGLQG